MRLTRVIVTLTAAASLGLPLAAAGTASAAPAKAAAVSTAQTSGKTMSATGPAIPNITFNPSCSGNTTWVVLLEYKLPNRGLYHWCFGFTGTWIFPPNPPYDYASSFCAGNNRGTVKVIWQGVLRSYSFGPGTRIAWPINQDFARLVSLTITGWSGSNTCPV